MCDRLGLPGESGGHRLEDRLCGIERRFLRHEGDRQAGLPHDLAVVERELARDAAQQRGLAGAVAPDQADPLARVDRQLGAVEQRNVPVGEVDVLQREQRHQPLRAFRVRLAGAAALFAAIRMRSAFSLMKPPASAWS